MGESGGQFDLGDGMKIVGVEKENGVNEWGEMSFQRCERKVMKS